MMEHLRYRRIAFSSLVVMAITAAGCIADTESPVESSAEAISGPYPILFVTQVPVSGFTVLSSAFGNHQPSPRHAPRGGDLYIRYPDGTLRNLTKEAGYGVTGLQNANGIAVREPAVHWDGQKALFSMIVGAPGQYQSTNARWQIYEVTGLAKGQTAQITLVPNQPSSYNNVSPLYGTDDRVIFTSDRPRNGSAAIHPQLDEYESAPTVAGLYSLKPTSGNLIMLNHAPSGVFYPTIDSVGRVIFTRWDHLQRDQQADADHFHGGQFGSFNYADESGAQNGVGNADEVFPEPRTTEDPALGPNQSPHIFNVFFPWTINEDGTSEETLNHVGNQELGGVYQPGTFKNDPNLTYYTPPQNHLNQRYIRGDGGLFHIKEDPNTPGKFYATESAEFGTDGAGAILSFTGEETLDAEKMVLSDVTDPKARDTTDYGAIPNHPGHFRNPLPLSDGTLVAAHTPETKFDKNVGTATSPSYLYDFRLKKLTKSGSYYVAGAPLTQGIQKSVSYYDPDQLVTVTGNLWELDPVEVRARTRPLKRMDPLPAPEKSVLQQKGVSERTLRAWLRKKNLAILVSRNVTTRDRSDVQQPFNLHVPGGVQTIGKPGTVYDVSFLQIFQGDLIRGYSHIPGRRVIAQPLHDPAAKNPPVASAPAGAVKIASDGSVAAIVPARRAMTWQLTDAGAQPIVRERNWLTFAPGEIRACPSCHGVNTKDQAGHAEPVNPPLALGVLLDYWNTIKNQ